MARTFSGTASAAGVTLAITEGPAWEVIVTNTHATLTLLAQVTAVNGTDFLAILPETSVRFSGTQGAAKNKQIDAVIVKEATEACTYAVGVTRGFFDATLT